MSSQASRRPVKAGATASAELRAQEDLGLAGSLPVPNSDPPHTTRVALGTRLLHG